MADEQNPSVETAPADPSPVVDPTLPPEATAAAVTSDPTSPSTSAAATAPSTGDPEQLASDFKKPELQTAAAVVGADVPSGATKAEIAQAIVDTQATAPVNPDTDHSPSPVVGGDSNVAPAIAGSGSGAAPDQTSGTPNPGGEVPGYVAPPSSTGTGGTGSSYTPAPVVVDNRTRRSGDDALLGSWVEIIGGPNAGRFGSYVDTVHHDPETGYPSVIIIRSRDSRAELLEAAYEDVRPSERNGGR